jgi:hypothetical protein
MTDATHRLTVLSDIDRWFGERGFGLVLVREDGEYWAHLFPKKSLQISAPRYGRGPTPEAAAQSARDRFREEEVG